MNLGAEKLAASMAELVTKMVQPALLDLCSRTEALHSRITELEVLAGIQPPSTPVKAKAFQPHMRWNEVLQVWEQRA